MKYFNDRGRRITDEGMRVFGKIPSQYYRLDQPLIDYQLILQRIIKQNGIQINLTAQEFKFRAETLLAKLQCSSAFGNLANGVHVPFIFKRREPRADLGAELVNYLLPSLQKSFNERYPDAHFKAVLQSNSALPGNISLAPESRYEGFIEETERRPVVGLYFPQALQEFDVDSQRSQMASLPILPDAGICLAGGMDICAAMVGSPDLLVSDKFYTPIPIMSAYVHADSRLVFLLKAYGPHLEFWCMTQMLTKEIKQVSEQWAGGLTIYDYSSNIP